MTSACSSSRSGTNRNCPSGGAIGQPWHDCRRAQSTYTEAAAAAAGRRWAAATLVRVIFLSTRISRRSRWFFIVLFKSLEIQVSDTCSISKLANLNLLVPSVTFPFSYDLFTQLLWRAGPRIDPCSLYYFVWEKGHFFFRRFVPRPKIESENRVRLMR